MLQSWTQKAGRLHRPAADRNSIGPPQIGEALAGGRSCPSRRGPDFPGYRGNAPTGAGIRTQDEESSAGTRNAPPGAAPLLHDSGPTRSHGAQPRCGLEPKPACKSFSRFSRGDGVQIRSRSTYTAYITTVRRERLRREPTG